MTDGYFFRGSNAFLVVNVREVWAMVSLDWQFLAPSDGWGMSTSLMCSVGVGAELVSQIFFPDDTFEYL